MNPYKDSSNIRSFSKNVKKLELVWHQDAEDRDIEVLNKNLRVMDSTAISLAKESKIPIIITNLRKSIKKSLIIIKILRYQKNNNFL